MQPSAGCIKFALVCTLVLAHRLLRGRPLVVLANRDELLSRPSSPPGLLRADPAAFGGRDELQGGTWCGINASGLFVGLTNLAGGLIDFSRRSRGMLVLDLLSLRDAAQVAETLEQLQADTYNGFNVIASDGRQAVRAQYDGSASVHMLEPGVHAATNWRDQSDGAPKRARAEALVREVLDAEPDTDTLLADLMRVGRTHERDGDPRASLCCHRGGYGTRSSTVLVAGPGELRFLHSEGAPCRHPYDDYSSRVAELVGIATA